MERSVEVSPAVLLGITTVGRLERADPKGEFHGAGGTMHVEDPRYENKMHDVFFRAAAESGLPANEDFNDWSHSQVRQGRDLNLMDAPLHRHASDALGSHAVQG